MEDHSRRAAKLATVTFPLQHFRKRPTQDEKNNRSTIKCLGSSWIKISTVKQEEPSNEPCSSLEVNHKIPIVQSPPETHPYIGNPVVGLRLQ